MTELTFRHPKPDDVRTVIDLVYRAPNLDNNSPYFYGMWIKEWWRTSAVALDGDAIVGVLLGFVRPTAPQTYFAWQTCIDPDARHDNIGTGLYDFVLDLLADDGINRMEMTVNGENRLVKLMLSRLARHLDSTVESGILFEGESLADGHYTEELRTFDLSARRTA